MNDFEDAVETFLSSATNLGDEDLPLIVALRETAKHLDANGVQAAMVNQFRLVMNTLTEKANGDSVEVDPLEALLS